MSQLSIMFVAGEIKQKLLHKFREFFFVSPFIMNCKILNKENEKNMNYEKLFGDNVTEQKQICNHFRENMKFL